MKLNDRAKKILKIVTVSALAIAEIYVIYAAAASMYTFKQHPPFMADDGEIARSSGYRVQSYLCTAFAVIIPFLGATLSYFMFLRKPRVALPVAEAETALEAAATAQNADVDSDVCGACNLNCDNEELNYPKPL